MDLGLKGKVALVTGVGSQAGMGKAIALALAREGCDVIGADIDLAGAEKTAEEVRGTGRKMLAVKADVTNIDEVNSMVKKGMDEFGKIDILVNNAGGTTFSGPLGEADLNNIEKEIRLNLMGVFYVSKAVIPHMVKNKAGGKILNISSIGARMGIPGGSGYCAAKSGVLGITKSLARELGPFGINVNVILPNLVLTNFYGGEGAPMLAEAPPEMKDPKTLTVLGRDITTEDIADTVLYFVSDMSRNVTGQALNVCGGHNMP
ncbi:MAG: SDR family oxidoreductase [Deltaproteobacteria bacterium]|nr:SDR family oxidoreductase [Deltaproteobacteria bacterium]